MKYFLQRIVFVKFMDEFFFEISNTHKLYSLTPICKFSLKENVNWAFKRVIDQFISLRTDIRRTGSKTRHTFYVMTAAVADGKKAVKTSFGRLFERKINFSKIV